MSEIEWTDKTWNPVTGCSKISEGCQNCYAERMSKRLAGRCGYQKENPFSITFHPDRLTEPGKWKSTKKIFVCSMGDLFHEDVDYEYILSVFGRMNAYSHHTFQILTKRPERLLEFCATYGLLPDPELGGMTGSGEIIPRNVWIGITAENQEQADKRIPILLQIPTTVKFVSIEPMLSAVNIEKYLVSEPKINWVICGGETGPGARPMHPGWVAELHDQCINAEVPFFFKQWGAWCPRSNGYTHDDKVPRIRLSWNGKNDQTDPESDGDAAWVNMVGKKRAGNLLDGKLYQKFPEVNNVR